MSARHEERVRRTAITAAEVGLAAVVVAPSPDLGKEALKLIAHKRPYLNTTGFIVRGIIFLGLATLFLL